MRVLPRVLAYPALALALCAAAAPISVTGAHAVDEEALRKILRERLLDPPDPTRSAEALRALWALRQFSDLQLAFDDAGGVALRVTELPRLGRIAVQGNTSLAVSKLLEAASLRRGDPADPHALDRAAEAIAALLRAEGRAATRVRWTLEPNGDLRFHVEEGEQLRVTEIHFPGAAALSEQQLRELLRTKQRGLLSFLSDDDLYRPERLELELHALRAAYWEEGHLRAELGPVQASLSADRRTVALTIPVREGPAYTVSEVSLTGDAAQEPAIASVSLRSRAGDRFRSSVLREDLTALVTRLQDEGHPFAEVTPVPVPDDGARTVALRLDLTAGPVAVIERAEVTGNTRTRDQVIRTELRFVEGERFGAAALRRSQERLQATGFFDGVELVPVPGSDEGHVVIQVRVKERKTGYIAAGGGASADGVFATAQLSDVNLLGRGLGASFNGQLGMGRSYLRASLADPHLFQTQLTGGLEIFHDTSSQSGLLRTATGAAISAGYHLTDELRGSLTYGWSHLSAEQALNTGPYALAHTEGVTASVRAQLTWDSRDDPLHPRRGMFHQAFFEVASPYLGGTHAFLRAGGFARFFVPLPLGITLRTNAGFGFIQPLGGGGEVPLSERYFLGGMSSVRGYEPFSLAPRTLVPKDGSPEAGMTSLAVGGNKQAQLNVELELPIPGLTQYGVRGVLFYDAGNVFAPGELPFSDRTLPLGLYHSVGGGLRWDSPMGPLRLELGVPLTRRAKDQGFRLELGFGVSF